MRFFGKYAPYLKRPYLYGYTYDPAINRRSKCHELLTVSEVEIDIEKREAKITLVAGSFVNCEVEEGTMCGPASSISNKTVIYPCNYGRCKIPCACHMCRKQTNFCQKSEPSKTCEDTCQECKKDKDDHFLFHKAHHESCQFCLAVFDIIPASEYNQPWMFDHFSKEIYPEKNVNSEYPCDKCDASFTGKYELKRHERSLHFGQKFSCCMCQKEFSRKDNLVIHEKIKHKAVIKKPIPSYQCCDCSEKFLKRSHLTRHKSSGQNHCIVCEERFCTLKQVQEHKRKLHSSFTCSHCTQCFKDKAKLTRHQQIGVNEDGTLKIKCDSCDARFCTSIQLQKHMKDHPKELFKCSNCGKQFTTRWRRNQHVKNSQDQICSKCGTMFCNGNELKIHIDSIHS